MNSGFHWPYGRREGVLPIWAHRRASAPGAMQFPRIIFQHRPEGYASRTCEDSTHDAYYCLSFSADTTRKDAPGRHHLRERVQQRQGPDPAAERDVQPSRVTAGADGHQPKPRGHVAVPAAARLRRRAPTPRRWTPAWAAPAAARITRTPRSYADNARAAMPEIDAVTMATPPADVEQTVMFSVPPTWPDGEYVAYIEINTEGDYNGTFNSDRLPDAAVERVGLVGDELRLPVPRPAVGRVRDPVHARAGGEFLDDDAGRLRLRRRHRCRIPACCTPWTDRSPTIRRARRAAAPIACA